MCIRNTAGFPSVAEYAVIALCIGCTPAHGVTFVGFLIARRGTRGTGVAAAFTRITGLIAGLDTCAEFAVVAFNRFAILTALHRIAALIPIAEVSIVTFCIVGGVVTRVHILIAGIDGAVHAIIAVDRRSG